MLRNQQYAKCNRFYRAQYDHEQVLDSRGDLLTALGHGLWPSMVLLSEVVQTFILADFCYYYVKRWYSISLSSNIKLKPQIWVHCSKVSFIIILMCANLLCVCNAVLWMVSQWCDYHLVWSDIGKQIALACRS